MPEEVYVGRTRRGGVGGLHYVAATGLSAQRPKAPQQPAQQPSLGLGGRGAAEERLQRAAAGRVGGRAPQRLCRQRRQRLRKLARRLLQALNYFPLTGGQGKTLHAAQYMSDRVSVCKAQHLYRRPRQQLSKLAHACSQPESALKQAAPASSAAGG